MNITQNSIDNLNAVLTVTIEKDDYKEKVEKALNNYRKNAAIKGFRKGQVPMSFVKKQFEKSIIFDEVNQLLQTGINEYIQKEKISILGNPLPKFNENMDWDADQLEFEFELGLAPDFKVDLSKVKADTYKVNVTDEEVQKYVDNFAKRFGSMKTLEKVEEGANVKVTMKELDADKKEIEGTEKDLFLFVDELSKPKKFIGKKVGDVVVVKAKEINEDAVTLEQILSWDAGKVAGFEGQLQFEIKEITAMEASPVDQSLFDKVYGEGSVADEAEFRNKIKTEAEKMYDRETDKQMMNEVVEALIKDTKFDLPTDFLNRWLHQTNDKVESLEQAAEEVKKMEDSLRYQLIEAKVAETYDLKVEFADVEEATRNIIKEQLAMYGQANIPEEDLERIVQGSLQNQQEFQRLADQVFATKMMETFKSNVKLNEKSVTFDEFVKLMEEKQKAHSHDHDHNH
ncbi:trigger factor [Moheibacter stercoris]|uniref:Trigger factor n=1 Tax=Moheibacter stercoris TaxID=1628251 RepID=A0ABV2LU65_9FLAO